MEQSQQNKKLLLHINVAKTNAPTLPQAEDSDKINKTYILSVHPS